MSWLAKLNPMNWLSVKGSYDSLTDRANAKHFSAARTETASEVTRLQSRKGLRNQGRYECRNNSYASGIGHTISNFTVGTGPRVQVIDHPSRTQIEIDFAKWAAQDGLAAKLRMMILAGYESGEMFFVRGYSARNAEVTGVALSLRAIECDRVTDPSDAGADGVKVDANGQPLAYRIVTDREAKSVPASEVIHYARIDRPGQLRGVPEIAPVLGLFAQLRRYTLAVLNTAENSASLTGTLESQELPGEDDEQPETYDTIDLVRGSIPVMPRGYKLNPFKAEQPTTTYPQFKREILSEIARVVQVPANLALGDSSAYNFASGKLDHQGFAKSIQVRQHFIELIVLSIVFAWWWEEYRLLNGHEEQPPARKYYWDGVKAVDPREASADAVRLTSNTETLASLCGARGLDWEEVLEQRARELKKMNDLGLVSESQGNQDADSDQEEDDKEPEKPATEDDSDR